MSQLTLLFDLPDYRLYEGERLLPVGRIAPCDTCPPESGGAKQDAIARLEWRGTNDGTVHYLCGSCLEYRYRDRTETEGW